MTTSTPPSLLDLPPETRHLIWSYLYGIYNDEPWDQSSLLFWQNHKMNFTLKQLIQTCKALHKEIIEYYITRKRFVFSSASDMIYRLRGIGPFARQYVFAVKLDLHADSLGTSKQAFEYLAESRTLRQLWIALRSGAPQDPNIPWKPFVDGLELVRVADGKELDFKVRDTTGQLRYPPRLGCLIPYDCHISAVNSHRALFGQIAEEAKFGLASCFTAAGVAEFERDMGDILRSPHLPPI